MSTETRPNERALKCWTSMARQICGHAHTEDLPDDTTMAEFIDEDFPGYDRLREALESMTVAFKNHLQQEAAKGHTTVDVLCPCWGTEVAAAEAALANSDPAKE